MLTLVKEDGTGKSDANSYASVADADAYHEGHLYASAWTGATTADKEKALVMATRLRTATRWSWWTFTPRTRSATFRYPTRTRCSARLIGVTTWH